MSTARGMLPSDHRRRAAEHEKIGRVMAETGHEWGAVCLFYAAYHHVKAALIEDTVFDDLDACRGVNVDLLPDDRYTDRHQGRRRTTNGREWGINDLVLLLYRPAAGIYERLHQMSIQVRYQSGLTTSVNETERLFDAFEKLRTEGALTSGIEPRGGH